MPRERLAGGHHAVRREDRGPAGQRGGALGLECGGVRVARGERTGRDDQAEAGVALGPQAHRCLERVGENRWKDGRNMAGPPPRRTAGPPCARGSAGGPRRRFAPPRNPPYVHHLARMRASP